MEIACIMQLSSLFLATSLEYFETSHWMLLN